MLKYEDIVNYSKEFNIPIIDVLFIALNRYGVNIGNIEDRMRFVLSPNMHNEDFFFALPVNTIRSPFTIKNDILFMNDIEIGHVSNAERDTCSETYFRKNKTAMTLNSNSRSTCAGCRFCGTYKLSSEERENFSAEGEVVSFISDLLRENNLSDLKNMESITICTGCFKTEEDLINHLILLKKAFDRFYFEGSIRYIGSQIQNMDSLYKIKDEIGKFGLLVTTEKFVGREEIMRPEKSRLILNLTKEFLKKADELGFEATFLYILGLEDLNVFEKYMEYMKDSVNKFPIVQIYQNYVNSQENYRCMDARKLDYYLKARQILERIYKEEHFTPESWENYRSLYYTKFKGKEYKKVRI